MRVIEKMEPKATPGCSNTQEQVCLIVPEQSCPSNPEVSASNPEVSENNPEFLPSIPELFKGKCVLVTGATGFLGKVLVEKLLRSCPGIQELFILIRPSIKCDVDKKFEDFLEQPVFDRFRNDESHTLLKIRPLTGDITQDNLGLNEGQYEQIISRISFVFHCAANVRFDDEPLNTMNTNLIGVKNILDFCKSCEKLEALVHVSTAFSFCHYFEINEQIYPELVNPQHVIEILRWMTNDQLRAVCMYYKQGRPTIYHLSKALAETLIAQTESLPAIIVRPSIVTASVNEPFPGWIDNYNGPSGFIAVCGKGIVRTLLVKDNVDADWVPVDIVANTLIVAAAHMAVKSKLQSSAMTLDTQSRVPIINCTCPLNNRKTWKEMIEICLPFLIQYPSTEVYGKPGGYVTGCPLKYNMYRMMCHYIPAILIDGATCLTLQKPRMICHYKSIHRVMGHLVHYTTHSFFFHSSNMRLLMEQLSPEDKDLFPIDQSTLNWTVYMENYVLGVRRYFLKEKDETLPEARVKMMRMHYLWLACKLSSMFGILLLIRALKIRGYKFFPTSLLPTYPYVSSAIAFVHRKLVFPFLK